MFKTEKVDVNLEVVDEAGELLAQGRSVGELRQQLGDRDRGRLTPGPSHTT